MLKTEELFFFLVLEETYGEKIYVVRRHCYASEVGLTNMVVSVHEDVNVNKKQVDKAKRAYRRVVFEIYLWP